MNQKKKDENENANVWSGLIWSTSASTFAVQGAKLQSTLQWEQSLRWRGRGFCNFFGVRPRSKARHSPERLQRAVGGCNQWDPWCAWCAWCRQLCWNVTSAQWPSWWLKAKTSDIGFRQSRRSWKELVAPGILQVWAQFGQRKDSALGEREISWEIGPSWKPGSHSPTVPSVPEWKPWRCLEIVTYSDNECHHKEWKNDAWILVWLEKSQRHLAARYPSHVEGFLAEGIHLRGQHGKHGIMIGVHQLVPELLHEPHNHI